MAFRKKCYCCDEAYPNANLFYCKKCLDLLSKAFETGQGVLSNPEDMDHCVSCGEYEDRQIVYTGNSGFFPTHPKGFIPICSKCVQTELEKYENQSSM